MKRRKVTYPVARTHTKGAPKPGAGPEAVMVRPNLVAIDLTAGLGRQNLKVGGRARILGTGLYAGEEAIIERLIAGRHPGSHRPNRFGRVTPGPDHRPRADRRVRADRQEAAASSPPSEVGARSSSAS